VINKAEADPAQVMRGVNSCSFATMRTCLPAWRSAVLLAVLLTFVGSETAWAQSPADEYHVKAAFLYHFTQLVEWPADASNEGGNSLLLCTLGDDPFHGELENTVAGKQIGSRTLRIRHVKPQYTGGCNVLFISKSESNRFASLIANLRNAPILTVGDDDGFMHAGGMIRLFLDGNKVRFEINRKTAESARLKISSQLLLLAKNVVGGDGRK
jgi:hypothetical protein